MKKIIVTILIAIIFLMAIGNLNTYQMQGIITNRNEVTDSSGHIWECDTDGFRVGDTIVITFHDRGTSNRTDDIIKNIK